MHLKLFPWLDDQRRSRSLDYAMHLFMRDDVCAAATAPRSFYLPRLSDPLVAWRVVKLVYQC